jgi:ACS family tartrate transporter-like MFS transporter
VASVESNPSNPATSVEPANPFAEQTRLVVTRRLMPYLLVLYFFAYIDRTNIGIAKIGMQRELGFTDEVIGLGAGIFFVGYLLFEIPSTLFVERWSARLWLGRIMITWGVVATLMGFVHTETQFYWLRIALGFAEAGFFPGVIVFLTHWFRAGDRSRAKSLFLIAQPISQVLGLPLSRWIMENVSWGGLSGWRWVFILEGIPSVLLGIVTIFYLTDWPRQAKWLSGEQRDWLTAEIDRERSTKEAKGLADWWAALRQPQIFLLSAVSLFAIAGNQSVMIFLPSITDKLPSLSVTGRTLVTMLPFVCSFFGILVAGRLAGRVKERRWFVAGPILLTSAGLAGAVLANEHPVLMVISFCVAGFGAQGYLPAFWTVPSTLLTKSGAAVAVGMITTIGGLGGMFGPWLFGYLRTTTGNYNAALWALVGCLGVSGVLATQIKARG